MLKIKRQERSCGEIKNRVKKGLWNDERVVGLAFVLYSNKFSRYQHFYKREKPSFSSKNSFLPQIKVNAVGTWIQGNVFLISANTQVE